MTNIRKWPKGKLPSVEILKLLANLRYEVRVLRKLTFEFSYRLKWTRVCWETTEVMGDARRLGTRSIAVGLVCSGIELICRNSVRLARRRERCFCNLKC